MGPNDLNKGVELVSRTGKVSIVNMEYDGIMAVVGSSAVIIIGGQSTLGSLYILAAAAAVIFG